MFTANEESTDSGCDCYDGIVWQKRISAQRLSFEDSSSVGQPPEIAMADWLTICDPIQDFLVQKWKVTTTHDFWIARNSLSPTMPVLILVTPR